jgi:NADPH:quinone reductase-like Zn-dependent oxidoreductase
MKAIVYTEYGPPDVLQYKEVEKPTPAADEVLVRVRAASLNTGDRYLMLGKPVLLRMEAGLRQPKKPILGIDIAGDIEAVGSAVTQFKPGDAVYGDITRTLGGFAEFVAAPIDALAIKPDSIAYEDAATIPTAGVTALQGLRDAGRIQAGQRVLIAGASGGVGTFAVQIAKAYGAEVTGVCSTRHLDLVRSIGADHVIDYTQEDFTRSGQQYDLILGVNGSRSLADYKRALSPGGIYVVAGGSMRQIFAGMLLGPLMSTGGKKMLNMGAVKPNQQDLLVMNDLLTSGKVKPVIVKRYPLSETADAMRYLDAGHAQGKVIITVNHNGH